VDTTAVVGHGLGMPDSPPPRVRGLIPAAVRIELHPVQRELLIAELAAQIETIGRSLRTDHEDRHGSSSDALNERAGELAEYAAALGTLEAPAVSCAALAAPAVTLSAPVADALLRCCAARAVAELDQRLAARDGDIVALRQATAAMSAWSGTLAELRELDETTPDGLG
jgi:hypothetical protein